MNDDQRESLEMLLRVLAEQSECGCEVVDGEVDHCPTCEEHREVGRRLAHLPD